MFKKMNMKNIRLEKYPSWPKGHPWKGCRSLTAARGFKSLLLRSSDADLSLTVGWRQKDRKKDKKVLTKHERHDKMYIALLMTE